MNLKLNLIENSLDFLENSLEMYTIANEYGDHNSETSDYNKKKKWKVSYILVMQSLELLIKSYLYKINPNLLYENIDTKISKDSKSVSFNTSLTRLKNFRYNSLKYDEIEYLKKAAKIRNDYIHCEVIINTEELKTKYAELVLLYLSLYKKIYRKEVSFSEDKYKNIIMELEYFNKNVRIFRGSEINKNDLEQLKNEIKNNELFDKCYTKDGRITKRIRFGEEKEFLLNKGIVYDSYELYTEFTYCSDCLAKKGEYHLLGCDIEICPICGGQYISCDCNISTILDPNNEIKLN